MDNQRAVEIFRALGVPSRMQILMLLKHHGPQPVKSIADALNMSSPAVSQHLKVLRHAGLVRAERHGYTVPYAVDAHALNDCCGLVVRLCAHSCGQGESCACAPENGSVEGVDQLRRRREELLEELRHIESELEALRGEGE
jgi:DNA-binding transcriptional ArsR family regulator